MSKKKLSFLMAAIAVATAGTMSVSAWALDRGDVDGNGVVNGSDVTALYNHLLNADEVGGDADVDGNGVINGSDVTALYTILLNGEEPEVNPFADDTLEANNITVTWQADTAIVRAATAIVDKLAINVSGTHVSIVQAADVADEYIYTLSGEAANGDFYQDGDYKVTMRLNGLNLTGVDSAAVNIQDGKRIAIELVEGTQNFLADTKGGNGKAALIVNGHGEFKGAGALTLTGNNKHAYWGDEYVELKKTVGTITVAGAVKDGFNISQYFEMKGGTVVIDNVGDDAIQVEATSDATDEQNGQIIIGGGSLTATVTAATAKGLSSESHMKITGGTINITNSGEGEFNAKKLDAKSSACLSTDSTLTITGGNITLVASGTGGKGVKVDSTFTMSGGNLDVTTTGDVFEYTDETTGTTYDTKPHAIKCDNNVVINNGTLKTTTASSDASGVKAEGTITIAGGEITVTSNEHGISAEGDITITGATITASSSGTAGKAIKSNASITIGGTAHIDATVTGGGMWDSDDMKTKASSCIGCDGDITVADDCQLELKATGAGGKGISCDGTYTGNGGTVTITTTGNVVVYSGSTLYNGNYSGNLDRIASDYKSSAKGIKADTKLVINGGTYSVSSDSSEGIESKGEMELNGGIIECETYDDCINSSSHLTITGGYIYCNATNNDAIDSNGNLNIKGGTIVALGGSGAECGIDANDEGGYHLYVTGGTFVAIGGSNISRPYSTTGAQPVIVYSGSISQNETLTLNDASGNNILAFTLTRNYSGGNTGGGGGWFAPPGGGPGGGMSVIMSSPSLKTGSSYTLYSGQTASGDAWHDLIAPATVSGSGTSKGSVNSLSIPYSTTTTSGGGGGWW